MSWDLVLGFFPEEMQRLILDNTISDLMINGTTGVFADRNGVVSHIPLASELTTDMLLAATQQIARKLGQNLSDQNPILNTRLPDGSRVAVVGPPASINGITMTIRKFNRWYSSDELIASGSMPKARSRHRRRPDWGEKERNHQRWNRKRKDHLDESVP